MAKRLESNLEETLKEVTEKMVEAEKSVNSKLMQPDKGVSEQEKPVTFECPMPGCGNTEYIEFTRSNGIHGPNGVSVVTGYECSGCSVRFGDLGKFSNRR